MLTKRLINLIIKEGGNKSIFNLKPNTIILRYIHSSKPNFIQQKQPFEDQKYELIYVGPLNKTAKYLKLFSISSLVLTFSLSPLIFVIDGGLSTLVRGILFGGAILTSSLSTALIHWCIHPYLTRGWVNKETLKESQVNNQTELLFENLSIMGKYQYHKVLAEKIGNSSRLFTTHKVLGTKELFYVHPEVAQNNVIMNQVLNLADGKLQALKSTQQQLK